MNKGDLRKALDKLPGDDSTPVVTPKGNNPTDPTDCCEVKTVFQLNDAAGEVAVVITF